MKSNCEESSPQHSPGQATPWAKLFERIRSLKVAVIGDGIVDEWIDCSVVGVSRASPTLVVEELDVRRYEGGAFVVAKSCQELGAEVWFDIPACYCKRRYVSGGKVLLRTNIRNETTHSFQPPKTFHPDLVILCDYDGIVLQERLLFKGGPLNRWIDKCGAFVAWDSQRGELPDFTVDLVTPTIEEAHTMTTLSTENVDFIGRNLVGESACEMAIVTEAENGCHFVGPCGIGTYPALNHNPVDVVGAGDALLAGSSMALAANATLAEAVAFGSKCAAVAISRVGNDPVTKEEVLNGST